MVLKMEYGRMTKIRRIPVWCGVVWLCGVSHDYCYVDYNTIYHYYLHYIYTIFIILSVCLWDCLWDCL